MHKLKLRYVNYEEWDGGGFWLQIICEATSGEKDIGRFVEYKDALKFAEWKALELALPLDNMYLKQRAEYKKQIKKKKK